jgi:hypothetical protein
MAKVGALVFDLRVQVHFSEVLKALLLPAAIVLFMFVRSEAEVGVSGT